MAKGKNKMSCAQCEKLIPAYMDSNLTHAQTTAFLAHISACSRCKEELTVQYLVEEAPNWLDADASFDINAVVEKSIAQNLREMKWRYGRAILAFLICSLIVAFMLYNLLALIGFI